MTGKTDLVRKYVGTGNYRKALEITKSFRMGITKDQHRALARAHECMLRGQDPANEISTGVAVLKQLYG